MRSWKAKKEKASSNLDYSDFPFDGSHTDQEKWFKAKRTLVWRSNALNSEQEEAFCEKEREHTLKYYYNKKMKKAQEEQGVEPDPVDDLDSVEYLDDTNDNDRKAKDKEAHAKEFSRQR